MVSFSFYNLAPMMLSLVFTARGPNIIQVTPTADANDFEMSVWDVYVDEEVLHLLYINTRCHM